MIVSRLCSTCPSRESRIEAFWKTLASEYHKTSKKPEAAEHFLQNIVRQWIIKHKRKGSIKRQTNISKVLKELPDADSSDMLPSISTLISSNKESVGQSQEMRAEEESYRFSLMRYMRGRGLMRTELGYLAISSKEARPKDRVVIIAGEWTPFILRQMSANQFTFVGEAYFHGMMYGEWFKGKDYNFQPIDIRYLGLFFYNFILIKIYPSE